MCGGAYVCVFMRTLFACASTCTCVSEHRDVLYVAERLLSSTDSEHRKPEMQIFFGGAVENIFV